MPQSQSNALRKESHAKLRDEMLKLKLDAKTLYKKIPMDYKRLYEITEPDGNFPRDQVFACLAAEALEIEPTEFPSFQALDNTSKVIVSALAVRVKGLYEEKLVAYSEFREALVENGLTLSDKEFLGLRNGTYWPTAQDAIWSLARTLAINPASFPGFVGSQTCNRELDLLWLLVKKKVKPGPSASSGIVGTLHAVALGTPALEPRVAAVLREIMKQAWSLPVLAQKTGLQQLAIVRLLLGLDDPQPQPSILPALEIALRISRKIKTVDANATKAEPVNPTAFREPPDTETNAGTAEDIVIRYLNLVGDVAPLQKLVARLERANCNTKTAYRLIATMKKTGMVNKSKQGNTVIVTRLRDARKSPTPPLPSARQRECP